MSRSKHEQKTTGIEEKTTLSKYDALKKKVSELQGGQIITSSLIGEYLIELGFVSKYNPERINLAKRLVKDGVLTSPSKNEYNHNTWKVV
jgi:hypothetical protein